MQDLNDKITGDTLSASEWDEIPSEIQNVITSTGQALSASDLEQLSKGIATLVGEASYFAPTGSANAIVLTEVAGREAPQRYSTGMLVRSFALANNTGAATVNVCGLGVKNISRIYGDTGALVGGEISGLYTLIYDGTRFALYDSNPVIQLKTPTGTGDAIAATSYSTLYSYSDKLVVTLTPIATNTISNPTLNIAGFSAIGAKTIYKGGAALSAGDIKVGYPTVFQYNQSLSAGAGGWNIISIYPLGINTVGTSQITDLAVELGKLAAAVYRRLPFVGRATFTPTWVTQPATVAPETPFSWTVAWSSTGVYVVTHNLATQEYSIACQAENNGTYPVEINTVAYGANSFTIIAKRTDTDAPIDIGFEFTLTRA